MADQILFDKLIYIDRLKRAGVTEDQARAHAEAMDEALREAVATKADIAALKSELKLAVQDMTIRTGLIAAAIVTILAAIKFFT